MAQVYDGLIRKAAGMLWPFSFNRHTVRIYVKDTGTSKGRGVYAAETIEPGEVIEECPVVQVTTPFEDLPMEIRRLVFDWHDLAGMEGVAVLALGFGSLYNHANPANAHYKASADGMFLNFIANERIEQDAEITVNYIDSSGSSAPDDNSWFNMAGIDPYEPE
ncbi:MAG: SET domain-containing protein-lysine N-methyltransferase [Pseudomonadota bacterium]|nr:SET domain-containing protein-lysine N-methyltransferase [Pseudomonadota bacterium]